MSKKLRTVDEVKDALSVKSLQNLSQNKIIEFVSLIPSIDKDVALSIINQFPAYAEMANQMVATLKEMCNTILENAAESQRGTIESYHKVLDSLSILLQKDNITADERNQIANKMIEVADKVAVINREHKNFLLKIFSITGSVLIAIVTFCIAIFAVCMKGKKENQI